MTRLYVATQVPDTREWIPVAVLEHLEGGFSLSYTRGAQRFPGFMGLGRMNELDRTYSSPVLFPFFANRLIPRSRPEYRQYIEWLGMDGEAVEPMAVLGVTGGLNTTGSFELVAPPKNTTEGFTLDFFPRGLRYLDPLNFKLLCSQAVGSRLLLAHDLQNAFDPKALLLRTEKPMGVAGYLPRYYCAGVQRLLRDPVNEVVINIRRLNLDAPLDMRILCRMTVKTKESFNLFENEPDFELWNASDLKTRSEIALGRTTLDFQN